MISLEIAFIFVLLGMGAVGLDWLVNLRKGRL